MIQTTSSNDTLLGNMNNQRQRPSPLKINTSSWIFIYRYAYCFTSTITYVMMNPHTSAAEWWSESNSYQTLTELCLTGVVNIFNIQTNASGPCDPPLRPKGDPRGPHGPDGDPGAPPQCKSVCLYEQSHVSFAIVAFPVTQKSLCLLISVRLSDPLTFFKRKG